MDSKELAREKEIEALMAANPDKDRRECQQYAMIGLWPPPSVKPKPPETPVFVEANDEEVDIYTPEQREALAKDAAQGLANLGYKKGDSLLVMPAPLPPMPGPDTVEVLQWLLVYYAERSENGEVVPAPRPVWIKTIMAQNGFLIDLPKHPMIVCLQCGQTFERGKSNQRFCCKSHGSAYWKRHHRSRAGQGNGHTSGSSTLPKGKQQTLQQLGE